MSGADTPASTVRGSGDAPQVAARAASKYNGVGRLRWVPVVLLILSGSVAAPGDARVPGRTPSVRTTISLDRLTYFDGVHRARFVTRNACVRSRDLVVVTRPCRSGTTIGSVGSAQLGFDVRRAVENGATDVAVLHTGHRVARVTVRVAVRLREPGDLSVEVAGHVDDDTRARIVRDSASGDGVTSRRRALWRVSDARSDNYEFTVQMEVENLRDPLGTFVPAVTVARRDRSSSILDYVGSEVRTAPAARYHILRFRTHDADARALPELASGNAYPDGDARIPVSWGAMPSFSAQGTYFGAATGKVEAARSYLVEELSPGAEDRVTFASMGWTMWSPYPGPKVTPITDFIFSPGAGTVVMDGFRVGIETADPYWRGSPPGPVGPLYDGDAGSIGVTMAAGAVQTRARREPTRRGGELFGRWDGAVAHAWSDLTQTPLPETEPNSTPLSSGALTQPAHALQTAFYAYARGGDVDNRKGRGAVRGKPIVLRGRWSLASIAVAAPREAKYEPELLFDTSRIVVEPRLGPGGYLLESTGRGWRRDWGIFHDVFVVEFAAPRSDDVAAGRTLYFAPGTQGRIDVWSRFGLRETFRVGPGAWRVTLSGDEATVRRFPLDS